MKIDSPMPAERKNENSIKFLQKNWKTNLKLFYGTSFNSYPSEQTNFNIIIIHNIQLDSKSEMRNSF
ncbi:hypothetical protein RCL_jg16416.t1 [Rhizophagus clarus]|uniref:Uncharacterized protein n=1 Tax=Rhizophagus clarus TaxID=94130 RepID=A0A8H3M5I2_9GLOM|nr:hypothetical protein RCL_jg16416.t1 [Rhizophagus clarus]